MRTSVLRSVSACPCGLINSTVDEAIRAALPNRAASRENPYASIASAGNLEMFAIVS
jgi:hypothetical protein